MVRMLMKLKSKTTEHKNTRCRPDGRQIETFELSPNCDRQYEITS